MLTAILLTLGITWGSFPLTYLFATEKRLTWRMAAGNIAGSAVFGTALFVIGLLRGLDLVSVAFAVAITALPNALFLFSSFREQFRRDWQRAKGRLSGANAERFASFAFYAVILVLAAFFFGQAMLESPDGILTGASQNLGDLPFHLGIIFSFSDAANFPPMNPNFAGTRLAYPFIADLITAATVKLGAGVRDAMLVESVARILALTVLLESLVLDLLRSRSAARLTVILLFLSGGLGFLIFFSDAATSQKSFADFLWHLPRDYTIGEDFRWGNSLTTLFITQRGFLLGLPLALLAIGHLANRLRNGINVSPTADFLIGLVSGMLVLIHLHSLFALFIISAVWTVFRPHPIRRTVGFGLGAAATAIPELIWAVSGTASSANEFVGLHLWWDSRGENPLVFWLRNTGLVIPLCLYGLALPFRRNDKADPKASDAPPPPELAGKQAIVFYLPFAIIFLLGNIFKFAPWEWDNIKILLYWYLGSALFAAYATTELWRTGRFGRIAATAAALALVLAGTLDVWRTISGQIRIRVFGPEAVEMASRIKAVTPKNARFLNAPTYNTAIVLTGRQSFIRYPGHLASHGIAYDERERDTKAIYAGGPLARHLLEKYTIDFVLVSPEERSLLTVNERFFATFPVVAEIGEYRLYKVR